jgi:hypothetical protein
MDSEVDDEEFLNIALDYTKVNSFSIFKSIN